MHVLICRLPLAVFALLIIVGLANPVHADAVVDWVQPTRGVAIAVDLETNVFTVTYEQALGAEMTVTKRDAQGQLLWEASEDQTDPTKWERATWIASDSAGNAIVSGTLMSGYSDPVNAASIIMKLDPAGTVLWRQVYESSFDGSYTRKCLVDEDDNVYVLGMGSGPGGYVMKVRKLAPDGTHLWTYHDADGIGAPINFKLAPDGQLVLVGRSIFGSINGYAKISLDGERIWSLPGIPSVVVGDAAGDDLGNAYVVHAAHDGTGATVVRKLDPAGATLWEVTHPFAGSRVEVGADRRPMVSGFPNQGSAGAAFIKLDEDGGLLWENLDADGPLGLLLHAQLVMDRSGNAYLAAGTLFEMAVCSVASDGASRWTLTMPGSYANALAIDAAQCSVFVVGGTTARASFECSPACPADLDGSGFVDTVDLLVVLGAWGGPGGDVDGDGTTGVADLLVLLTAWGAC